MNDLIGGQINVMTVSVASGLPAYQAGQLKMLGIAEPQTHAAASRTFRPSTKADCPAFRPPPGSACSARPACRTTSLMKIDSEVIRIFNDPAFRARFLDPQMFESMAGPPEEFAAYIRAERDKWSKIIREANIKLE